MDKLKIISWNTAKRLKHAESQIKFILQNCPDVVALQEIIPSTEKVFRSELNQLYPHQVSSFELVDDLSVLTKKRMFGQLILSKFPLSPKKPNFSKIIWPERLLSASIELGKQNILLHTTHIPPGSSNGWIKIEMINGVVSYLIENAEKETQILCGDFNTPQLENEKFGVITWGQKLNRNNEPVIKKNLRGGDGKLWDAGERSLFVNLNDHGIVETFRQANPNDYNSYSWSFRRKDKWFHRRFDHFFASNKLKVLSCDYLNPPSGLSDHLPIFAEYSCK
jgi:exonuclease III